MNMSQRPDSFEPGDYLAVLRRRWWIVLVLAIMGMLAAAAYVAVARKVYTGTASVYVTATALNTSEVAGGRTASGTVNMDSEAQIVQSNSVATLAAHALHSDLTTPQLIKKVSVTVPANSQILQISCTASSADAAANCAEAFAKAYLANQVTTLNDQYTSSLKQLQSQANAEAILASSERAKIVSLPANSPKRAIAHAALTGDNSQLSTLNKEIGNLKAQQANTSPGTIPTNAAPPSSPTSPQALLLVPSGLIAGLLIGLIVAFLVDRRDKRIHDARDIERYLDLPVMLSVTAKKHGTQPSLVGPRSRTGQGFAELANGAAAALGEGNHVLVVAGTSTGPGGSVTAANLATALARTRSEVALVCADLHGSVIPELFHLGQGRGLSEVLGGSATISEVARRPADFPRLRVVTPGVDTSFSLYNFQHDATRDLISELRERFPFVVIEAQAAGEGGDAFALAEFADAALIAVEVTKTTRPEIADCLLRLDRLRTTVLGAVLIPPFAARKRSRPAEASEQRIAPAERRPRSPDQRPEPVERHPEPSSPRQPLKVGMRDPSETWPLPLGAVRTAADKPERTPPPDSEREDSPDEQAGS
jgi:capsular polysaccharide biosynthesis protein